MKWRVAGWVCLVSAFWLACLAAAMIAWVFLPFIVAFVVFGCVFLGISYEPHTQNRDYGLDQDDPEPSGKKTLRVDVPVREERPEDRVRFH